MMGLATLALAASALVGGLSTNPAMYAVSAALLGVYFALDSGLADSIVYDTLVEEVGSSEGYEKWIGRLHVVESCALVVSALLGGLLAELSSARSTYIATVPIVAGAAVAFWRCREPRLHRASERVSYRRQAAATLRALGADRGMRRIVLLSAIAAAAAQVVFEFGPLWLVSLHAPPVVYGPYWAALITAMGLGGWVTARVPFARTSVPALLSAVVLIAAVVPVTTHAVPAVIAAQVVIALEVTILAVRAGFLMHEAVNATVRAGVSSAASTLSWATFLPIALVFGWLSRTHGVQSAGWVLVLIAAVLAALCPAVRGGQPVRS
jgi:MFS family permease